MKTISTEKKEWSDAYIEAMSFCSPHIKGFLKELNDGSSLIDWALLDRNGFRQSDGSYFRVICSLRSAKEQIAEYQKGREGVKYEKYDNISGERPFSGTKYYLVDGGSVVSPNFVSTNAFSGQSFHNWGLAVDLVFRHLGENKKLLLDNEETDFKTFYQKSGILALAKKYKLQWGSEVNFSADMSHFEDSIDFKIPPKEYFYDKNMNYDFISWYYSEYLPSKGGYTAVSATYGKTDSGFKKIAIVPLLLFFVGFGGLLWFLFFKKKSRRF